MLTFRTSRHNTATSGETWSTAYLKIPRSHPWYSMRASDLPLQGLELSLNEPHPTYRLMGFHTPLEHNESSQAQARFEDLETRVRALHALGNTLPLSGEIIPPDPTPPARTIIEPFVTESETLAALDMCSFGEFWLMQGDSQLAVVHWSTGPAFSTGVHVHPTRQDALNFITTLL